MALICSQVKTVSCRSLAGGVPLLFTISRVLLFCFLDQVLEVNLVTDVALSLLAVLKRLETYESFLICILFEPQPAISIEAVVISQQFTQLVVVFIFEYR